MSIKRQKLPSRPGFLRTSRKHIIMLLFSLSGVLSLNLLIGACGYQQSPEASILGAELPNPASEHCIDQGHQLEILTAADGSQSARCIFQDGSSCDEWAFFRGECSPPSQEDQPITSIQTNDVSAVLTANPADYQGWWTYLHPVYNFTLLLPEDWIVEEITSNDALLAGHLINLHPRYSNGVENIRITFKKTGEDAMLWPTGVGHGEFVPQGTLDITGEPVPRYLLVCPTGETTSIWYHQAGESPAVRRGELEFAFIFQASSYHCESGFSLAGKNQMVGEMIISSLNVQ